MLHWFPCLWKSMPSISICSSNMRLIMRKSLFLQVSSWQLFVWSHYKQNLILPFSFPYDERRNNHHLQMTNDSKSQYSRNVNSFQEQWLLCFSNVARSFYDKQGRRKSCYHYSIIYHYFSVLEQANTRGSVYQQSGTIKYEKQAHDRRTTAQSWRRWNTRSRSSLTKNQ